MTVRSPLAAIGGIYVVLGLLGFALGGFHGLASEEGATLVVFKLTPLHNALHLLLGWFLVQAATGTERRARRAASTTGAVLLFVAVAGPALHDVLSLGSAERALYAVGGAAGLVLGVAFRRGRRPATFEPGGR